MTNQNEIQNQPRGGMTWSGRLFMIFWTAITIIMIAIAIMMYVSLVPHFFLIGWIMLIVVSVLVACGIALIVTFTIAQASIWWNRRNLIVAGEVVAYRRSDGSFEHLSAVHVSAGLLPQVRSNEDEGDEQPEPRESDDATIIELYNRGLTLQSVAQATGATYYRCQKVVAQAKKRGLAS